MHTHASTFLFKKSFKKNNILKHGMHLNLENW